MHGDGVWLVWYAYNSLIIPNLSLLHCAIVQFLLLLIDSYTMNAATSDANIDVDMTDLSLLVQTQKLIHAEKRLTALLLETEPWLPTAVAHPHRRRIRPTPTSMDQVDSILALARKYAAQTSAPAGWNPAAPVVGFCTPSPLPNQLRAGCLAALQLERAQAERKRKRDEQKAAAAQAAAAEQAAAAASTFNKAASEKSADEPDPKRREINRQDKHVQRVQHQAHRSSITPKNAPVESMALDDSSDDDDSDEE